MPQEFDRDRNPDGDRDRDRDFDRDRNDGRDRDFDRDRNFDRRPRRPLDFFRFFSPGPPPTPPRGGGPPSGPPPRTIPRRSDIGVRAVDPGAIRFCLYRFTYIWPERRPGFWFYPVFVGPRSISGFRWTGRTWVYFGMDLNDIESFQCV